MTDAGSQVAAGPPRWIVALGGLIVLGFVGYFGFLGLDSFGLAEQRGTATVVGKEYLPAGTTYRSVMIGGQNRVVPQATGEQHLLALKVGDDETVFAVDRGAYQRIGEGDRLPVVYRRTRLTGALQVVEIAR
ncbi:MAG: hypothetical protein QNJ30_07700 [Kiloniellales bacterium]|nr:hypothetical protein [Kiloniellales bacterium]